MTMLRACLVAAAVGLTSAALSGCGGNAAPNTAPPTTRSTAQTTPAATQSIIYSGLTSAGNPSIAVSSTAAGSCWEGSVAADRSGAWRCTDRNGILDPCFGQPGAGFVVCPENGAPWSTTGLKLRLTKPLGNNNNQSAGTAGDPWALALADGAKCTMITGTVNIVDGMPADYGCTDGDYLYGQPSHASATWTIFAGAANASQITQHAILTAWF